MARLRRLLGPRAILPQARQPPSHLLMILHHPHRELMVAPEPGALSSELAHIFARGSVPASWTQRGLSCDPASSPDRKRALTRLWFWIGGCRGQRAGAGGVDENDWLRCSSLLLMHQSPRTRRCGEPKSFPSCGPAFAGLFFNSLGFLFRRRWRR